jgi:uncharacterized protein
MLVIEVGKIGPEGLNIDSPLTEGEVHVQGEETFTLESGRLVAHVDRDDEGTLHVLGELHARLGLECGRCLEPYSFPVDHKVDLFILPHQDDRGEEDEVELTERELVVAYYRSDRLDLGEMIREQLFLSLPMKRLCQEDCRGLCRSCGTNRNRTQCACVVQDTDPRLASLKKLLGN